MLEDVNVDDIVKKKNLINIVLISLFASFSYMFFAPTEYYFVNLEEVWYDLYTALPLMLFAWIVVFAVLALIGFAVKKSGTITNIYGWLLTALSICLYVQGNFIIVRYDVMNGEEIEWNKYAGYNWSSIVAWGGIIVLCTILFVRFRQEGKALKIAKIILGCMILNELFTLVVTGTQSHGFAPKRELVGVTEGKWDYSENENLLILLLDTFDSRILEASLKEYDSDEMRTYVDDIFENFTFYRDNMGIFSLTDYAVPQILTGELYLGEGETYSEYIERAYGVSPLLNHLKSEKWSVNIHAYSQMPQGEAADGIENLKMAKYKVNDYKEMYLGLYNPIHFRYFPTPLKQYVYAPNYYYSFKVDTIDGDEFKTDKWYDYGTDVFWDNNLFYYGTENISSVKKQNVMHFYHLKGLHALRDVNEDMEIIEKAEGYYTFEQETKTVLKLIDNWLNKLKEEDLYDNSAIIILGDHGSVRYGDPRNYGQAPVLMIKGVGDKKDFCISEVPLSYVDIQEIAINLSDGMKCDEAVSDVLKKDNIDTSVYDEYDLNEFIEKINNPDEKAQKTGRTRKMIYHFFTGNLGQNNQGDEGYEFISEYPTYWGERMEYTGKIYK